MNEIILGDCIDGMKQLPDNSVDIVLADPPYFQVLDAEWDNQWKSIDEYIKWSMQWIDEAIRLMKQSATMYIYGIPENLSYLSINMPIQHRWLIWHYKNRASKINFWSRSFDAILCAWKNEKQRIFNLDSVRTKYSQAFLKGAAGKKRKSTPGMFSHGSKETVYNAHPNGARPKDVIDEATISDLIEVGAVAGGSGRQQRWFWSKNKKEAFHNSEKSSFPLDDIVSHPSQKPVDLTSILLLAAKPKENCKVLIPFAGSFSECAVCDDYNLDYTAFEIDSLYFDFGKSFLSKRKNNKL